MKKCFSKNSFRVIAIALGLFMWLVSVDTYAQKPNFSGKWAFNADKSKVGEGRMRPPKALSVTQSEKELAIDKTTERQGEERTTTEKYTLDGKVCENQGFMGNVKKSTATWTDDGKSLTIASTMVFERDGNTTEIKTTEIYKLSDDGKQLILDSTTVSPMGETKWLVVFDKK